MTDIKNKLDVLDKMIDHVQRKIRSNDSMMGMVNSTFEYETFTGVKENTSAITEMQLNVKALGVLLDYRAALMNYSLGINGQTEEPTLTLPEGFKF